MNDSQQTLLALTDDSPPEERYVWATDNCAICDYQGEGPDDKRPIDKNHGEDAVKHLVLHGDIGREEAEWIITRRSDLDTINWSRGIQSEALAHGTSVGVDEISNMLAGYTVFTTLPPDVEHDIDIDVEGHLSGKVEDGQKKTRSRQDMWTDKVNTFFKKESVQEELAVAEQMRQKCLNEMSEPSTSFSEV